MYSSSVNYLINAQTLYVTTAEATKVTLGSQVDEVEGALKKEKEKKKVKANEDILATVRKEYKDSLDNIIQPALEVFQNVVN